MTEAKDSYRNLQMQLEKEYDIIYKSYTRLNLIESDEDKVKSIERMMTDYVLR